VRATSKRLTRKSFLLHRKTLRVTKKSFHQTVSTPQLERYFAIVRGSRNWTKPELQVIYKAVKAILERYAINPNSQPDLLDWQVEFQLFPDYSYSISAFIIHLEDEKKIPDMEFSESIVSDAEEELEFKAAVLGKYILDPQTYHWLKLCERNWKKTKRDLDGWPF
jgi:hypothetical protein